LLCRRELFTLNGTLKRSKQEEEESDKLTDVRLSSLLGSVTILDGALTPTVQCPNKDIVAKSTVRLYSDRAECLQSERQIAVVASNPFDALVVVTK